MKRILLFLTVFLSTLSFAGERVIINPEQDQDIKVKVNDGGTVVDAITVAGATGNVTLGASDSTAVTHTFQGNGIPTVSINQSSASAQLRLTRTGTSTGSVFIGSGSGDFRIGTAAGGTEIGVATSGGAWTLGANSTSPTHRINGFIGLPSVVGANPGTGFGSAFLGNTGQCVGAACDMTMDFTLPGNSSAFVGGVINVTGNAFNGSNPIGATFSIRGRKDLSPVCVTLGTNSLGGGLINSITCTFPSAGVVRITVDGSGSASINAHVSGMITYWD